MKNETIKLMEERWLNFSTNHNCINGEILHKIQEVKEDWIWDQKLKFFEVTRVALWKTCLSHLVGNSVEEIAQLLYRRIFREFQHILFKTMDDSQDAWWNILLVALLWNSERKQSTHFCSPRPRAELIKNIAGQVLSQTLTRIKKKTERAFFRVLNFRAITALVSQFNRPHKPI